MSEIQVIQNADYKITIIVEPLKDFNGNLDLQVTASELCFMIEDYIE